MCIFGGGGGDNSAALLLQRQQLEAAQQAQAAAAAKIAEANLDTESSRAAAENRIRRANMAEGFTSALFGGQQKGGVAYKTLFGQ